ncbi:HTH-type transcriptional activator RhaR [Streptomyces californicus]
MPLHRDGGQAQFVTTPVPEPGSHPLADLLPWALQHLDRPLTVEDLARRARMSSRHLARHFRAVTGTTPLHWLHTQRIRRAQELLETTDDTVDAVATSTGMGTATTLRRHFHRTVGVPPTPTAAPSGRAPAPTPRSRPRPADRPGELRIEDARDVPIYADLMRSAPWWALLSSGCAPVLLVGSWAIAQERQGPAYDPGRTH